MLVAAKRSFQLVKLKAQVCRRVKTHLEKSGIPSKHLGSHGADRCLISMAALDAHIDDPEAWGDAWYPPIEMLNVREYVLQLKSILRLSTLEDGTYFWQLIEPFHALLPGFILILFGKLVAFAPQDVPDILEPFLLKIRSGNPLSQDIYLRKSVYINTQEIHPLLSNPHSIIARGMIPNTREVVKPPRQNRFYYVGTPLNNVGMSVFEFGTESGSEKEACIFADIGIAHPFTASKALPPAVYATQGVFGLAGALTVKLTEGRKPSAPYNAKRTSEPKASARKRQAKGGAVKSSQLESESGGEEEHVEDEVDEDVLSLAEWSIRNTGFVFISREHRFHHGASSGATSNREIVEKYGLLEFGKDIQNIEKDSCELMHPLDSLDTGFSCESFRCVQSGRFAIVYFVSGPKDLLFIIVHSRPTFAHMAKVDDTCSSSEIKDTSNDIRIVTRTESFIAKRGEFVYFDPTTLVKVSVAPGSPKQKLRCPAVEIFSISFGGCSFPRSGRFQEKAYPLCLAPSAKRCRSMDEIMHTPGDKTFEPTLLAHLFQFPGVVDFLLPCFVAGTAKRTEVLDLEWALEIVSNPPKCSTWAQTNELRRLLLVRSGFIKDILLSSLSVWTLISWIDLASTNPNFLFNEVICLEHAMTLRSIADRKVLLSACALLAETFPRVIPSFNRVTTKQEMMTALEGFVEEEDASFDPQRWLRSILCIHPETKEFTAIPENDWQKFPSADLRKVLEKDSCPQVMCRCKTQCLPRTCIIADSGFWCCDNNCTLSSQGKVCSNNPRHFKPLSVVVGYSGNPNLKNALYAQESCEPGRYIGEYTGEVTYVPDSDRNPSSYAFSIDCTKIDGYTKSRLRLDAQRKGSLTRFVNHSHGPTCITVQRFLKGKVVIWFQSISWVFPMMELTFDYGNEFIIPLCLCHSNHCPGTNVRK